MVDWCREWLCGFKLVKSMHTSGCSEYIVPLPSEHALYRCQSWYSSCRRSKQVLLFDQLRHACTCMFIIYKGISTFCTQRAYTRRSTGPRPWHTRQPREGRSLDMHVQVDRNPWILIKISGYPHPHNPEFHATSPTFQVKHNKTCLLATIFSQWLQPGTRNFSTLQRQKCIKNE